MLLWDRLETLATNQPGLLAVACEEKRLTYAELAEQARRMAAAWTRQGLEPGDRIALHLRNSVELAVAYYACFAAGFVAVPVNNRFKPAEIEYVVEHSGARLYVSEPSLYSEPADVPLRPTAAGAPALLLYTSGTTARPKGVIHTQRTLRGNAYYMEAAGLTRADHTLLFTPMVHASGAIMLLMSSLWAGASVTIVPAFEAGAVLDTWARCGATIYMGLPTLIRALVAEQRLHPRAVGSGRLAICGGDAVPIPLQREYTELFGHPIVEGFGMTEGLPTILNLPGANRRGSMGRAMGDVELRTVDGELWMRGSGITPGYWGEPPLEDGWLKTGDLVDIDAGGFVWFRGRKKEIIVRGGSNLSPQEIEEALYKHPAVAEAGVIGEPDEYWGEVPVAFVALRGGEHASAAELIAFAKIHLADYKAPTRIVFMPTLPKGVTGKVQRRALRGGEVAIPGGVTRGLPVPLCEA
jgi:long-chain acyl-CoA synthetase